MTAREPLDLDGILTDVTGHAAELPADVVDCVGCHIAVTDVPALVAEVRALRRDLAANEDSEDARLAIAEAEVARLRPVVEAARRVVYPGGVDEFNGLVAAVSVFNAESPAVPGPEVPW
ncbi:hypothetical protein [Plantactinospora sp. WMMB782]|uniref:hypothetical protein n=1 Tax=Plantactinospora sp. WMMB782 TaxID=3404121 RepID=UPI003B93AF68